jgi:ribonuclease VapC
MVIDTSAIVTVLMDEPEQQAFAEILAAETTRVMSAVSFYEAALVMAVKKATPSAAQLVDDFVRDLAVAIIAAGTEDAVAARDAYFKYGRGFHSAGLNFADCFVYALAKSRNEPLLFKGEDFAKTDILPAWQK